MSVPDGSKIEDFSGGGQSSRLTEIAVDASKPGIATGGAFDAFVDDALRGVVDLGPADDVRVCGPKGTDPDVDGTGAITCTYCEHTEYRCHSALLELSLTSKGFAGKTYYFGIDTEAQSGCVVVFAARISMVAGPEESTRVRRHSLVSRV